MTPLNREGLPAFSAGTKNKNWPVRAALKPFSKWAKTRGWKSKRNIEEN
jgi:hypothetical protein